MTCRREDRGVGGPVHIATITSDGLTWVQRPEAAEPRIEWYDIGDVAPTVIEAPADGVAIATYTTPTQGADLIRSTLGPVGPAHQVAEERVGSDGVRTGG